MKYGLSYTLITRVTGFLARTMFVFRRTELKQVCEILEEEKGKRILDYGCNTGFLLKMINKNCPSNELCGADINPYALRYARKKYPNFSFFKINDSFFEKEKFDVVIVSHVLEHVHERDNFLSNLNKILKKGGKLIVLVPQERVRGDATIFQLAYNFMCFRFVNPHVVKLDYQDLEILLNRHGFKINSHVYTNYFFPRKSKDKKFYSWSLVVEALKEN